MILAAGGIGCRLFVKNYKAVKTYEVGEKKVRLVRFNKPFLADHFEITIIKTSLADSLKNDSKILLNKEEDKEHKALITKHIRCAIDVAEQLTKYKFKGK